MGGRMSRHLSSTLDAVSLQYRERGVGDRLRAISCGVAHVCTVPTSEESPPYGSLKPEEGQRVLRAPAQGCREHRPGCKGLLAGPWL